VSGRRPIDLRSDTVTRPSPEMRRAMAEAEVGDDVFGDDPTVNRLQELAAETVGCEAALFTPSGSMANQIAVAIRCRPGDGVIAEAQGHTFNWEVGAMEALSGAVAHPVAAPRGLLSPSLIEAAIPPDVYYVTQPALLVLENSHAMAGGTCLRPEELSACAAAGRAHGLAVHLDGARLFNACVATGSQPAEHGRSVDSLAFCLSKGLGAPVGSLLCGSAEFVREARRVRKRFGGGMRQVGVLAAAGLVALEQGPALLGEDHRRARRLADGLSELPTAELDPREVETNIVMVGVPGRRAADIVGGLAERGVLAVAAGPEQVRFVTHRDVDDEQVDAALAAADDVFRASST
jgi:threonine aldolase